MNRTFWALFGLVAVALLVWGGPEHDERIHHKRQDWWN